MGSFNGLLDAKFMPPRNWSLDAPLKFKSQTLTKEEREMFVVYKLQKQQAQLQFQKDTLQTWLQFLEFVGRLSHLLMSQGQL